MMGVRQTTDFLEKATWTIGGVLVVLCLVSAIFIPNGSKDGAQESQIEKAEVLPTQTLPAITATMPASTQAPSEAPAEAPAETPAD